MKWPFARQSQPSSTVSAEAAHVDVESPVHDVVVAPSRRDWAALPPLQVAGGRAISLTSASREFTQGLASRQNIVQSSARLEHVRHYESPSGSLRGVLAPSAQDSSGPTPDLREASALPSAEHRQLSALGAEPGRELSPIEQLLAIGETSAAAAEASPVPELDLGPSTEPHRRMGLADSRRHGLGPAYHGTLPEALRAQRERSGEAVPSDLRATMRDVLGVDVGDRLVHRGPAVSAEANAMGAQAFTRDGEVYVSDDVGPLDQSRGRATLAHELTHAAQQRAYGSPDEHSEHGRAMEAHAQQVEQYVRGDASAVKPSPEMLHAKPGQDPNEAASIASTRQMMRELVDSGLARSDGAGGIVFTMPPSAMLGTQRQVATAPHAGAQQHTGAAAQSENWSGLAVFGNTLAQGLGNDLLGFAGSAFGFSDEFMGEQRGAMADADREFRRQQTQHAFAELRMEHLRTTALQQQNAEQDLLGRPHLDSLDQATLDRIEHEVEAEVARRLDLLREQSERALERINEGRHNQHQTALERVPDENYDTAFHRMFDDPDNNEVPTADELVTMLAVVTGATGTRPGGGTTPPPPGGAGPTPPAHTTPTPTGTAHTTPTPTPTAHTTPTPTGTGTGGGTGADAHGGPPGHGTGTGGPGTGGAEHHEEAWRTAPTMRGRFEGLGQALAGDIAHAELGFFGSFLGLSEGTERQLHQDVDHDRTANQPAGAHAPTGATTTPHTPPAHTDAAHPTGAAHDAHTAAHTPASHSGSEAHAQVDHIVSDPYALDELANRLYPNIRTRLRQELLIDRERAGLLADFR